jgi:L-ascorbate metabolism protein UlaG (beta-lactamase superfamily)
MAYRNLDGSGPQPFGNVFKWGVADKLAGRRRSSPAHAPMPRVDVDPKLIATAPAVGSPARLTWLGHASWLIQLDGQSLVIDPVLGKSISGVVKRNVEPGVTLEHLPKIDATLITHNHRDHLDTPSVARIAAPMIAGAGTSPLAASAKVGCSELEWWQSTKAGPVTITFVPSQHWSGRTLFDNNKMLWGGFVIEGSTARIYHSGDTAFFTGFKEIGKRHPGIDAALLPIGAYDPQWFMGSQHMNPEEAVQAFEDLGARYFVAMHWGTFKLTDEPLDEPPVRLEAEWKKRGLPPNLMQIPPVGAVLDVRDNSLEVRAGVTG